jgi:CRP/FNR family transcriptional regulator
MANYLGIARETVSRKISRMEKEGIVLSRGNKRLRVLRPDLLAEQAAGDGEE